MNPKLPSFVDRLRTVVTKRRESESGEQWARANDSTNTSSGKSRAPTKGGTYLNLSATGLTRLSAWNALCDQNPGMFKSDIIPLVAEYQTERQWKFVRRSSDEPSLLQMSVPGVKVFQVSKFGYTIELEGNYTYTLDTVMCTHGFGDDELDADLSGSCGGTRKRLNLKEGDTVYFRMDDPTFGPQYDPTRATVCTSMLSQPENKAALDTQYPALFGFQAHLSGPPFALVTDESTIGVECPGTLYFSKEDAEKAVGSIGVPQKGTLDVSFVTRLASTSCEPGT